MKAETQKLLSTGELADQLGVNPQQLGDWLCRGFLHDAPCHWIGRTRGFDQDQARHIAQLIRRKGYHVKSELL